MISVTSILQSRCTSYATTMMRRSSSLTAAACSRRLFSEQQQHAFASTLNQSDVQLHGATLSSLQNMMVQVRKRILQYRMIGVIRILYLLTFLSL
jgi:hypothetical protein